jgi:nucleotide-binding universal stress UspA family protein
MSRFISLLLPLDGSADAAKGAGCALWLTEALGATLHVLHGTGQPLPSREALARLHIPGAEHTRVVMHQFPENAGAAVLEAVKAHGVDLVVMCARGASISVGSTTRAVGSVARAVMEQSPVPVLLFPVRYREVLPWTSMLAAVSGEIAADRALEAATRLAAALRLKVTVVHAEDGAGTAERMPLGRYADAAHHEYPHRIEEMVERGLTGCTSDESRCVDQALLRRGDPAAVLLEQASRRGSSVLAVGWHGTLDSGRALVLKRLLQEAECPLLLVRETERSTARLKVGDEIDD